MDFYVFRVGCEGCASALSFALTDSEQKAQETVQSGHQGEESQTKYIKNLILDLCETLLKTFNFGI